MHLSHKSAGFSLSINIISALHREHFTFFVLISLSMATLILVYPTSMMSPFSSSFTFTILSLIDGGLVLSRSLKIHCGGLISR